MFRTSLSQLNGEQTSKVLKKPSLTVPHQVYSIREIIIRSQRGLPVASRPLPFESDSIDPDINKPEDPFVDKFEAIDTVREFLSKHRNSKSSKAVPKERTENVNGKATEEKASE